MTALPEAAQRFIDATNDEDRAALVGAFIESASVDDFGRVFTGPDEIGAWSDAENIGTHNRIRVLQVTAASDSVIAAISVSGDGYNGEGSFTFRLEGDRIRELIIRG